MSEATLEPGVIGNGGFGAPGNPGGRMGPSCLPASDAGHARLLSKNLMLESGRARGNFPQIHSHVDLVTAAARLSRSWQEAS
jgi:hypothetical protein